MRRLRAWFSRLGEVFSRKTREQELTAEMESHLQLHIADNSVQACRRRKPGARQS